MLVSTSMCKKTTFVALLFTALTSGACFAGSGNSLETVRGALGKKLDAQLSKMARGGYSGAVIVAQDGKVILRKGYGLANREKDVAITADTVFTIGSITKQFTGAAILKLEMQGKLSVQEKMSQYLDGVPADKEGITIHQLLTHTAGFPEALGSDFDLTATRNAFLRLAMDCELLFPPGSRHKYSNVGYSLLGMIVEKASGMGYETYLRQNLFEPAGMDKTGYLLPKFDPASLAVGYSKGEAWGTVLGHPMLADGPCWHLRANGGIHSTVDDMYRWHRALEGTAILSTQAKTKYFAAHVDEGSGDSFYGYGWVNFTTPRGTKLLAHNGGNPYFSADFRRYVDEDVVIFHATNSSKFNPDRISDQLAQIIFAQSRSHP